MWRHHGQGELANLCINGTVGLIDALRPHWWSCQDVISLRKALLAWGDTQPKPQALGECGEGPRYLDFLWRQPEVGRPSVR